ncbi:YhcH/YjgK/YiaL family protein [Candidatus Dependentiae bacterium]|nr:YhcH/YjgK/YiaL family protein [Candidatus Dependentiae bacterium]
MIIADLNDAFKYYSVHNCFEQAFEFLKQPDISSKLPGIYKINGKKIYANITAFQGLKKSECKLESHKKYIDIQYVVAGTNYIGLKHSSCCINPAGKFDRTKDVIFYSDKPDFYAKLSKNKFAVLFPEDAHSPSIGTGSIKKIIVKVQI